MRFSFSLPKLTILPTLLIGLSSMALVGCTSDDDEDTSTGYFQFYNASENSPSIYLTAIVDEEEETLTGASYGKSTTYIDYDTNSYAFDLAWQDDEYSLKSFYEGEFTVAADYINLIVLAEEIDSPSVYQYAVPVEDPDAEDGVFNIRFLNMHTFEQGIDIYLSEADETFNEATLLASQHYSQISDGSEHDLDNYVFYITAAGNTEVLYQSSAINFSYTSQYIFVVRNNDGAGSSPFTLDKLSSSNSTVNYADENSEAEIRAYNGINTHELLPEYSGTFDLFIGGMKEVPDISALPLRQFSEPLTIDFGDYAVDLTAHDSDTLLTKNQLLTLGSNTDKTAFFYLYESVTENDDGSEDTEVFVNALVVENSNQHSLYSHSVNIINLVNDHTIIDFYFVRNNETIDTAAYKMQTRYITPQPITLLNNTYSVYAIATENNSERILATMDVTLDETQGDLFILLEEDMEQSSGYSIKFAAQSDE